MLHRDYIEALHDHMYHKGIEEIRLPHNGYHFTARRSAMRIMLDMTLDEYIPALCLVGLSPITQEDLDWARKALSNDQKERSN
jgi:hypothetical protein